MVVGVGCARVGSEGVYAEAAWWNCRWLGPGDGEGEGRAGLETILSMGGCGVPRSSSPTESVLCLLFDSGLGRSSPRARWRFHWELSTPEGNDGSLPHSKGCRGAMGSAS